MVSYAKQDVCGQIWNRLIPVIIKILKTQVPPYSKISRIWRIPKSQFLNVRKFNSRKNSGQKLRVTDTAQLLF